MLRVRLLRLAARPTEKRPTRVQPVTTCALGLGEAEWPVMAEALSLVRYFRLVSMSVLFLGLVSGHIKPSSGRLLGLPARKKQGEEKGQ